MLDWLFGLVGVKLVVQLQTLPVQFDVMLEHLEYLCHDEWIRVVPPEKQVEDVLGLEHKLVVFLPQYLQTLHRANLQVIDVVQVLRVFEVGKLQQTLEYRSELDTLLVFRCTVSAVRLIFSLHSILVLFTLLPE